MPADDELARADGFVLGRAREIDAAFPFNPDAAVEVLDPARVPASLHVLIPLASRWGIGDDIERSRRVEAALPEERRELIDAVEPHTDELDQWLAGDEATSAQPTPEYLAFTCLRMAADEAKYTDD